MTPQFAQRQLILAGIAMLAAVVTLAVANRRGDDTAAEPAPTSVPVAGEGWYNAIAAPYRPASKQKNACGRRIRPDTPGVAHPVLPCGAKIVIAHDGHEVVTEVVDLGPKVAGRDFDVTVALAQQIELREQEPIQWRWARAPDESG